MDLRQTQAALSRALEGPPSEAAMAALHGVLAHSDSVGDLSVEQRIAIYRNNVIGAQVEALRAIFPVSEALLGEACFAGVAQDFVATHPSTQSDLNVYGEQLPDFLSGLVDQQSDFAGLAYLRDVALLEWHFHAAYYQDDDLAFDFGAFERRHQELGDALCFRLSAALVVLQSDYPVVEIWQAHRDKADLDTIHFPDQPQYICLHREDWEPRASPISGGEYDLLKLIQDGHSLGEMAEKLGDAAEASLSQLPSLIQRSWIVSFG